LRSSFTESDSSLLLELLSPDAGAPPAETLVSSVDVDADAVAAAEVSSVLFALVEAVDKGCVIVTDEMLTMGLSNVVRSNPIIDSPGRQLRSTVYRLGLIPDTNTAAIQQTVTKRSNSLAMMRLT
jgi:hypothetical protein